MILVVSAMYRQSGYISNSGFYQNVGHVYASVRWRIEVETKVKFIC